MIRVTKEEAMAIRQMAPDSHVTTVNRQSSHKKYFAEENAETAAILADMRQQNVIYSAGNFGPRPKAQSQYKNRHDQSRHRHTGGHSGPNRNQHGWQQAECSSPRMARSQGGVR